MTHLFNFTVLLCVVCVATSIAQAQSCVDNIPAATAIKHFQVNQDGTLTHHKIMWSQCALGQTWRNGKCEGEAQFKTWNQSIELANTATLYNYQDWRLPTIHELSSITELSCQNPAINLQLFPDTPSVSFWAGTEFINDRNLAWQVFFGSGENHTAKKSTTAAIRLVRTIKK